MVLLLCLTSVAAMAQSLSGFVSVPDPALPGAYRVRLPANAAPQPRDIFEVHRGADVLGEAMAVQSAGAWCLLPTTHFHGQMREGDVAVFLRHTPLPHEPPHAAATTSFRAFSNTCRIRLMSPVPSDELIYDNDTVRIQFDFTRDDAIGLHLQNKTAATLHVEWNAAGVTTREGQTYRVVPLLTYQKTQNLRPPNAEVGPQAALEEQLMPLAHRFGGIAGARLLPPDDDPKAAPRTFTLTLPIVVDKDPRRFSFVFSAEVVPRRAYLGLNVRAATGDELATLSPPRAGALVITALTPQGPAWNAGLQLGDVIVEYDGKPATTSVVMNELTNRHRPGDYVKVVVVHHGTIHTFSVKLSGV
jgi:hypothetical protein